MPVPANRNLAALFHFDSVAVVGASESITSVGGAPIHLLRKYGFEGAIYGVNPRHRMVQNAPCFATIEELPRPIDIAVICIRAAGVVDALERLLPKGLKAAVVFSGGFAETGEEGRRLQAQLNAFTRRHGVAVLGPNCAGYVAFATGRILTFASQPVVLTQDRLGSVALLSQSGGVAFNAWADALAGGARFSHLITTGNEGGLTFTDFLDYFADDPTVSAVLGYIEGLADGAAFCRAAAWMRQVEKPIVVLKGGLSETGREVAGSHTAQLSSADAAFQAACDRYGIIRAATLQDLNDYAAILSAPLVAGGMTLATNSGGAGVYMADLCERSGVKLTVLTETTLVRLREVVPSFGRIRNPVDVTAQIVNDMSILDTCLDILLDDPGTGTLVFALTGKSQPDAARAVIETFCAAARHVAKPIVLCWLGVPEATRDAARRAGLTVYADPARYLLPLGACRRFYDAADPDALRDFAAEPPACDRVRVPLQICDDGSLLLSEKASLDLLESEGLACPRRGFARSPDELDALSRRLTFPVVMKISEPPVAHKSDIGGVRLGIASPQALNDAWIEMRGMASEVMVAEQVSGGVEVLVGCIHDEVFGMRVTLASGGIWADTARDAVTLIPPLTLAYVRTTLRKLACWPALSGARGKPALAVAALEATILGIAAVVRGLVSQIDTFECNPVIVTQTGAIVVDALGLAPPPRLQGSLDA